MLNLEKYKNPLRRALDPVRNLRDALLDLRPSMRAGARELRSFLRRWFDSEGEGSWPAHASSEKPLKPSTVQMRRHRWGYYGRVGGGGTKKLRWSGALRRSIFQRGASHHIERVGKKSLVFGSDYVDPEKGKPLILYHDLGYGRNPVRNIFPIKLMHERLQRVIHIQIQRQGGFGAVHPRKRSR